MGKKYDHTFMNLMFHIGVDRFIIGSEDLRMVITTSETV